MVDTLTGGRVNKLVVILALLVGCVSYASAQVVQEQVSVQNTAPSGSCSVAPLTKVSNIGTYQCIGGVWTNFAIGSGFSGSPINPQTSTYQAVASDFAQFKTISVASGTFTITLVASGTQPANGQYINIQNYGSGVITIARSGQNINGGTASLTLPAGSATAPTSVTIASDGTNYFSSGVIGAAAYPGVTSDGANGLAVTGAVAAAAIVPNGGTPLTSESSANSQIVTCPPGGTSTQYCGADGAWHTSSGGGGGGTSNGLSVAQTLNPAFSTSQTGKTASGTALFMLGDSTFANYGSILADFQAQANSPGQPLYGMQFNTLSSTYSCSGGNYVFTVPNTSGLYAAGTYFGSSSNGSPTGSLTQAGSNNYWIVVSSTATTVTATQQITIQSCATGGNVAGMIISPNVIMAGYSGADVSALTGADLTSLITAMQSMKTAGYSPILVLREAINDVRVSEQPLPVLVGKVQTQINTVLTATGLSGIPIVFIGENSINSWSGGINYLFPNGTASSHNVNPALVPSALTAATPATVTLTNPTGQSYCPPDMWGGPGMPVVVSSQGNNFTALLDTVGSGAQETVTVTALTPNVTGSGVTATSTCTVTFTPANSHSSSAPLVSTNAWTAQSASDQLWMLSNAVQAMGATTFPTLRVVPTQGFFTTRYASPTVQQPGMADQLHMTGAPRVAEDNAISNMVASVVNLPTQIVWNPPVVSAAVNTTAGWLLPESTAKATAIDPLFSQYQAAQTITSAPNSATYWHPWSTGLPAYQFGCEDSNLFDTILASTVRNAYTAGGTTLVINAISAGGVDIFTGAVAGDEIAIPGYGCYSGQISSVSNGTFQLTITLTSTSVLPSIPATTPVYIQRYRSYASAGLEYVNWPQSYPYHRKVTFQGAAVSAVTFTTGHAGTGYATNDTITMACLTTNFVGTVTASAGAVTAIAVTTAGVNCVNTYGVAPIATSGSGTGLLVNLTAAGGGSFSVAGNIKGYWTADGSSIGPGYIICGGNEVGCTTLPASNFSCSPSNASNNTVLACTDSNTTLGTTYLPYLSVPVDVFAQGAPDVEATNLQAGALFLHDPAYPASSFIGRGTKVQAPTGVNQTITIAAGLSLPTGTPTYAAATGCSAPTAVGTNTNTRGSLSIACTTATTGTIGTVNFSAALAAIPHCSPIETAAATAHGLSIGGTTTGLFNVVAAVSVASTTVTLDYICLP
jgi:hypothetical protein